MKLLDRRLQKLEGNMSSKTDPSAIIADLTWDERNVWLLVLSHLAIERDSPNLSAEEIEKLKATIEKIEAYIRRLARSHSRPEHQKYIERTASDWRRDHGGAEYIPALFESEYDGMEKSNIMERRRAIRAEPLIAALLEVTEH